MEETPAALVTSAVSIGHELMKVCDALGQTVAANHIAFALDILLAHRDLLLGLASDASTEG